MNSCGRFVRRIALIGTVILSVCFCAAFTAVEAYAVQAAQTVFDASSTSSTDSSTGTSSTQTMTITEIYEETTSSDSGSGSTNYSGVYSTSEYIKPGNYWATPVCRYGEPVIVALPIVNMTPWNVTQVVVTPIISGKAADWPFEINASGYTISFDVLVGSNAQPDINERTQYLYWTFMTREDVLNGYYPISFQVLYLDDVCNQGSCTISTYVECIGKPDAGNKNTDEKMAVSTPRIIVTGFETSPSEVYAGNDFDLIIHLKNTSQDTEVSNVEVDLTATVEGKDNESSYSAFLPTSGSNTAYFSSIPEGGSADIRMTFNAKADLAQKPYVMKLDMKYEDNKNNPYTGEASVSIPVMQDSRYEISSIDMTPASITIGGQANAMFSVYNTGKTKLYNVKALFKGESITNGDAFIGNLDSGATGNIDTMLTGVNPTTDDGTITVTVSYENERGQVFSEDFYTTLYVNPPMTEDMGMMGMEGDISLEAESPGFSAAALPLWIKIAVPAAVLLILIGLVGAIISRRRKKKRQKELETDYLDD
ncbi:MAG TPA: hypothetical protein DCL38_07545 [Lachnospiraceae bacterium]|nr:hypothetical protein [Lachnospiraceae bacterium]